MTKIKRIVGVFFCLFLTVSLVEPALAKKKYWPKMSEDITADAAIVMNVDTGTILYKKHINKKYYPASITKILTTLIAIENSSMDEIVTFSEEAIYKTEGSGIGRDIGEEMTMEQCLYAIMLESANECAYAVAEHVGGSLEKFVDMMNEKAKEMGCTDSHFNNPHGLTDENHYVTAKDMAIIACEAYQNETFRLICGTKRYTIPPTNKHSDPTYLSNHHLMLNPAKGETRYLYEYCTGGKTGYTIAAGNTLVTFAQKDGMTLVVVILSGHSPEYWNETRSLFDFGFENFSIYNVAENVQTDEKYEKAGYDILNTNRPYAEIDPSAKIVLPKTVDFNKTSMEINYDNLSEGAIAQLIFSYGDCKVGTANIIQTNTVIEKNELNSGDLDSEDTQTDVSDKKTSTDMETGGFSLKENFLNFLTHCKEKLSGITKEISGMYPILLVGIVVAIIFMILLFRYIFNSSYLIRQKIANFKSDKRAKKQYTIIKDTRRHRGRRRKKR